MRGIFLGRKIMGTEQTGADIVVQALTELGVEVVFVYPGGAVLPI